MIDIMSLLAKTEPYVSLFDHCVDTGKAAGILWDLSVISQRIIKRDALCLLVALHDLGKCHPFFQRIGIGMVPYADELWSRGYLPENEKREYRHEIGSENIFLSKRKSFKDKATAKAVSKILRLHHQKSECDVTKPFPKGEEWERAQDDFIAKIEEYFGIGLCDISFEISDAVCTMLWGIVILADWLVSGGLFEKIDNLFEKNVMPTKPIAGMFGINELRPLQKDCEELAENFSSDKLPRAIIIEAPMGEGKTEAALYLATQMIDKTGKNGFYIALPTMATARSMEERVSKLLSENSLGAARLVHSEAWLDKEVSSDKEVDKSWFSPTKRSLLSNYAVGTVDQAMMSVLRIKQGVLRLLGLSTKVLIIDEVHAYDAYMQTIIFRLLEWCAVLDIPVIILSATLPRERREKLLKSYNAEETQLSDAYPLITAVYEDGSVKETAVKGSYINKDVEWESIEFRGYKDAALRALSAIKNGGCACIIMNTVKDAQEVYAASKEYADSETELMLFHSKFLAKDRKAVEERCLRAFGKGDENRPKKALLVATQVVEQSLDVDFDYMISALAPIDLLLQRVGRLHRHERNRPSELENPRFTILINGSSQGNIAGVYNDWITGQTQKAISKRTSVNIPSDIRPLIEEVYGTEPDFSDSDFDKWIQKQTKEEIFEGKAKSVVFPSPASDWFFPLESGDFFDEGDNELINSDAATRIGDSGIKVAVLPDSLWKKELMADPDIRFAKQVMDCCVSVRIPKGGELLPEGIAECGGYLKGVKAVRSDGEFVLNFSRNKKPLIKKYEVDTEYGLMEVE